MTCCYSIRPKQDPTLDDEKNNGDSLIIAFQNDCSKDVMKIVWNDDKKDSDDHEIVLKPGESTDDKPAPPSADEDKGHANKLALILVQDQKEPKETVLANVQFQNHAKSYYVIKIWDRKTD